jgi:hypothetical protein
MTQSFVGTREQVLSALMHAIRQLTMVASHGSHVRLSFGEGPDADSGVSSVLSGRLTEREFAAFLGPAI